MFTYASYFFLFAFRYMNGILPIFTYLLISSKSTRLNLFFTARSLVTLFSNFYKFLHPRGNPSSCFWLFFSVLESSQVGFQASKILGLSTQQISKILYMSTRNIRERITRPSKRVFNTIHIILIESGTVVRSIDCDAPFFLIFKKITTGFATRAFLLHFLDAIGSQEP